MVKQAARVFADIDISLDGFIAGDGCSKSEPLGRGGDQLVWYGDDVNDGSIDLALNYTAVDAQVLAESSTREGAVIMGRNTFDLSIDAWGQNPPIHKPCFVLTRRPAPEVMVEGGTTFTFVSDPVEALQLALQAANGKDVGIMGGAQIIRLYLSKGLIDELHLHLVPVLLGSGIRLFDGSTLSECRLQKTQVRDGLKVTHLSYQVDTR